jgi:hypothetical protein
MRVLVPRSAEKRHLQTVRRNRVRSVEVSLRAERS